MAERQDLRKTRNRANDKSRTRLFNELAVTKLRLAKDETEATYRDRKQAGLLLRINKSGAKSWRVQFYDKALRRMRTDGLGEFKPGSLDHVTVKQARDAAAEYRSTKKHVAKARAAQAAANSRSFRAVAEEYLAEHVEGKRITADRIKVNIEKLYPEWENKSFEEITRADVVELLRAITKKRGPRAADITLVTLRRMMTKHAIGSKTGYLPVIVPGMQQIENPKDRARDRVLTDQEIRALFAVADKLGTFGALCKMCLYTAQRRGKVAEMRFSDIEDGVWVFPKDDKREKGTGERLKLPPAALAIIAAQEKVRTSPFVFPSSAGTAFSGFGKAKHELDVLRGALEGIKVPPINSKEYKAFKATPFYRKWNWIIHDLRRSARTLMSRVGVISRVAEKVMGHVTPGVEDTYDRWGYDPERADALLKLSSLISEILQPPTKSRGGNVVTLRR